MYGYNAVAVPKNVVIYARVSTEHEAQLSALENQLDWYKPLLEQHPEWTFVRSYVDEGITGTSAKKRPQFMQMLNDAKNGDFNLILTREVSRFARNTVDTLQYTRFHRSLAAKSIVVNASLKYIDKERKSLKNRYSTFEQFAQSYEVPQSLIDGIVEEGKKQDIKPKDDDELQHSIVSLRHQLKALVARDLWDMNEYFRVFNEHSDIVKEGLRQLTMKN